MRKKMNGLWLVAASMVLFACSENKDKTASGRKVVSRNLAINAENGSNPVFFDSLAMEKFIQEQKVSDSSADGLRSFYNNRNYQFAWLSNEGLTEQALAFKSMYDFGNDSGSARKKLDDQLDELATESAVQPKNHLKTELMLSWRFILYVDHIYPSEAEKNDVFEHFIPASRSALPEKLKDVLERKETGVKNEAFSRLKEQVKKYADISGKGGWPVVSDAKNFSQVKKRLTVTGEYTQGDTVNTSDDALKKSITNFQASHGLTATGKLSEETIREMNVPVEARLKQLLVNLERMRWMPETDKGRSVMVNIPEFRLHARNGKDSAFNMNVVVGKEANGTILFSSTLNQVVFSPYWNLPRSIVRKEVIPAMEKNKEYLREKNMEITGEENGLPVIRQLPGEHNALGKVKFLFPNSFDIYFHDTPEKSLFQQTNRAYSHGCIRLADPLKMAIYSLEGMNEWTPEKITAAMNSGEEKWVRVKQPIQVMIAYYTSWVDENGLLQFRNDLYDHDKKTVRKLFL